MHRICICGLDGCILCYIKVITYIVSGLIKGLADSDDLLFSAAKAKLASAGVYCKNAECKIYKRSVDARHNEKIKFVCSVAVSGDFSILDSDLLKKCGIALLEYGEPSVVIGDKEKNGSTVVVGSGPAGLFASLLLAENGYFPILLERGADVDARIAAVDNFKKTGVLDADTNIQFGAGGAGTFSDGKLVTRVNSPLCSYVLKKFVEFGAPDEILYMAKPHIGTDYLRAVVRGMTKRIEELGGKIMYRTKLLDVKSDGCNVKSVITGAGEIETGILVLATGHSARDTYKMLMSHSFSVEPKPFSVGVRAEHLQTDIDAALYGKYANRPELRHAEYNMSHNTKSRGVYTFCMCPGGEVVPAASEEGGVVVNGMSYHARDGKNANSAIAVSIFKEDYGNTPMGAIEFQRSIERRAFAEGGGDYRAPVCTLGDFLSGEYGTEPKKVVPTYAESRGVTLSRPENYLPDFVCNGLRSAFSAFGNKIKGYDDKSAVLTGAETRTSSPVRIIRTEQGNALGFENVYPCGEGAGYAGGITSAALDGINIALSVMKKYSNRG